MFVFRPIAAIAVTIKKVPACVNKPDATVGIPAKVFMTAATMNPKINHGKTLAMLNDERPDTAVLLLLTTTERISAIGTIIKVRVSLTIVARLKAAGLQEAAAATTDEVSFIAVPAHIPKPTSFMPNR